MKIKAIEVSVISAFVISVVFAMMMLFSHWAKADEPKQPPMQAKFLRYQFNESVMIVISNVACKFPQYKDQYPWAAAAFRIDGEKLIGCFRKLNEEKIEIQWRGGDTSKLPANAFLQPPQAETRNQNLKPDL